QIWPIFIDERMQTHQRADRNLPDRPDPSRDPPNSRRPARNRERFHDASSTTGRISQPLTRASSALESTRPQQGIRQLADRRIKRITRMSDGSVVGVLL